MLCVRFYERRECWNMEKIVVSVCTTRIAANEIYPFCFTSVNGTVRSVNAENRTKTFHKSEMIDFRIQSS